MATLDFIVKDIGIWKDINFDKINQEIDMLTRPSEGISMINKLYDYCDNTKKKKEHHVNVNNAGRVSR